MGRLIGSVVIGYFVMFVAVFVTFSGAYLLLGAERAFEPGSYDPSTLWIAVSTVLAVLAAVVGGLVCAAIARDPRGPKWLAGLVLVLGIVLAIPTMTAQPAAEPRGAEVGNMEAMQKARTPLWVALLHPLIGAAGVLVGGRRRSSGAA